MIINEFKKLWGIHYLKWVVVAALILNALVAHGGVAISHTSDQLEYTDRISRIITQSELNKEDLLVLS